MIVMVHWGQGLRVLVMLPGDCDDVYRCTPATQEHFSISARLGGAREGYPKRIQVLSDLRQASNNAFNQHSL